ncbi:MAG TPA: hypothetical protein DFI01_05820 [Bacteroidales bacterium]|nr:hypothetical protein [Bacteroidales bacterium]HQG52054.1 prenyltransferase/squalene oxidase repeat-containing protein [Bacteroidales bacterium]
MRLWEKPSMNISKLLNLPQMQTFKERSLERTLKKSLNIMEPNAVESLKRYIKSSQSPSGGFIDKAGKADIYYTLFGYFLAEALGLEEILSSVAGFIEVEIEQSIPSGVNLYCEAILAAKSGKKKLLSKSLRKEIKSAQEIKLSKLPVYEMFMNLLTCYYLNDYKGLYRFKKQLPELDEDVSLTCPVISAMLVIRQCFNLPVDRLQKNVMSYYNNHGGFFAGHGTALPDLLSTAVALYALRFSGADISMIKPDCLSFIDSMYCKGGFYGNKLDMEPDIEYTFYGLLALGALAE